MSGALRAGGFIFLVGAFIETGFSISQKFVTRWAKLAFLGAVALQARKIYHSLNYFVFPFQLFIFQKITVGHDSDALLKSRLIVSIRLLRFTPKS